MASATPDDFLSGQGVPVELHDIETELTRLWGPAADEARGEAAKGGRAGVTRIVLANLVVVCRPGDDARLPGVLDTVAAHFPSRTIVLRLTDDPGRSLQAEVSALCHLPAPGLPQVCSERIILRAGPQAVDLLPGAVRPLLEADLPFVLWWADDPRKDEALFRDLGDECSRLILDLPDPVDPAALWLGLDNSVCPFGRDTAWFGITRWRELVAHFFDPPCEADTLRRISSVRIEAAGPTRHAPGAGPADIPPPPRVAVWLAAWLAGQLGWTPEGTPERAWWSLRATFAGPTGPVAVEIATEADESLDEPQIQGVTVTTRGAGADAEGEEVFRLARATRAFSKVRIEADSPSHCALPRTVLAPELDPARRIAAALESSRNDPPFHNALPYALWLLQG